MSKTQIEMCKILREMNNTIKELNKTVKTLFVEIKHINEKIDDKYYLEKKEKEEKKRKEEIIQQSKINEEKELKRKEEYLKELEKFNNQYFKILREEKINKIIKHTYDPLLSDLDNWILAEKLYDYPFTNNTESILQYLNSLMIPITIDILYREDPGLYKINAYGIIIENRLWMYYNSIKYGCKNIKDWSKECMEEYLDNFNSDYHYKNKCIKEHCIYKENEEELLKYVNENNIDTLELYDTNSETIKYIFSENKTHQSKIIIDNCETASDIIKNKIKNINNIKIIEHMLIVLGVDVLSIQKYYYKSGQYWNYLIGLFRKRGYYKTLSDYDIRFNHKMTIIEKIPLVEELLIKDGFDISNFKENDYLQHIKDTYILKLLLILDEEKKYLLNNYKFESEDIIYIE
jgi:hypothetical protein